MSENNRENDEQYHAALLLELEGSRRLGRSNVKDIIAELGRCGVEVPPENTEDDVPEEPVEEPEIEEPDVDENAGRRTATTRGGRQRR